MNEKKSKNSKNKKWHENLKNLVKEQIEISKSFKEFEENILEQKYSIKVTEKTITVTNEENQKVRLKTLDKMYTNEYIFNLFEEKEKLVKEAECIKLAEEKTVIAPKKRKRLRYKNYVFKKKINQKEFHGVEFATLKF